MTADGEVMRDGVTLPGCPAEPEDCRTLLAASQIGDEVDLVAAPTAQAGDVIASAKLLCAAGVDIIGFCPAATRATCEERVHDVECPRAVADLGSEPLQPMLVLSITDADHLILGSHPIGSCTARDAKTCPELREALSKELAGSGPAGENLLIHAGKITWASYIEVVAAALAAGARPRLLFELKQPSSLPLPKRRMPPSEPRPKRKK